MASPAFDIEEQDEKMYEYRKYNGCLILHPDLRKRKALKCKIENVSKYSLMYQKIQSRFTKEETTFKRTRPPISR